MARQQGVYINWSNGSLAGQPLATPTTGSVWPARLVELRDNHTASSVFDSTQCLRPFLPWSTVSVIIAANSQGHSPEFCWTLRAPGNAKRCMQMPIYAVGGDFNKLGPQRDNSNSVILLLSYCASSRAD